MKCPSCGAKNAPIRRFCGKCGRSLLSPCGACGFVNEPGERFCGGCGAALGETGQPVRALGGDVGVGAGERRQLTVLFCDLVDSTRIGRRYDPESLQRLLQGLRRMCADCVRRFDGVVTQFLGDGILACFGFPVAHEDDAERAVRAALALRQAAAERRDLEELPLDVRIGVSTGLVVTSDEAEGREALLAMVGDPLAMAARLQTLAPPNGIVLGPLTRELVGDLFEVEELGEHRLKGFELPIRAWNVLGERRGIDRFGSRRVSIGLSAFVGREHEQSLLARKWSATVDGHGQAVALVGEPGIGKSRTVANFLAGIAREPHSRVRYFCMPDYRDSPFHPALQHLERAAGMEPSMPVAERRQRLERMLRELVDCDDDGIELCARMLGCADAEHAIDGNGLAARQRERFHELLLSLLRAIARRSPVVLVVEDAHWIDPSTADFLARVVEALPGMPTLLFVTMRPESVPAWIDEPHVAAIPLNRLDGARVRELVRSFADPVELPAPVVEEIAARSDGVPLFVEELTRHLLARTDATGAGGTMSDPVPDTLRDLLMARLDGLGPARLVAQAAAVLGRRFRVDLLATVLALPAEELAAQLARLRESGLATVQGDPPEAVGIFRHALVHDVAIGSLLRDRRRELHLRAAEALERDHPELGRREPELVALHFAEAGEPGRAVPWHLAAGERAASRYARAEARSHYEMAYRAACALPAGAEAAGVVPRSTLALAGVAADRNEVLADLRRIEDAEQASADPRTRASLHCWSARLHYVLGRFEDAARLADESLELANEAGGEEELAAQPLNLLARLACLRNRGRDAALHARENIRQMRSLDNRVEEAAMTGVLAFGLALWGRFDEAVASAARGVELAREVGHLPTLAAAHCYRGVVHAWRGEAGLFETEFEATLELADRSGDLFRRYLAHGWRGQGHLLAHAFEPAGRDLDAAVGIAERIGTGFHLGAFVAFRAKLHLLRGRQPEAEALARHAVATAEHAQQSWGLSIALRIHGETLLARPRPACDEALRGIDRAVAIQEDGENHYDLAWSHLARARAHALRGRVLETEDALGLADTLFAEMKVGRGRERVAQTRERLH